MSASQCRTGRRRTAVLTFCGKALRFVIIFGLAFIILKPFAVKILMAFMSPEDLTDSSVNMIPKHFSLHYWKQALDGMELASTAWNTVFLSVTVGLIQVFSSTTVAYGLARFRFKGNRLAFIFVIIMLLIPPQVTSVAKYLGFKYMGIGSFTVDLIDTFFPLFISAFCCMGLKQGLYIYLMREFFRGLPKDLENSAYIDGASPYTAFFRVILPNALSMMTTVFLFSFCWQWTDLSYPTLYLSTKTVIPVKITELRGWLSTGLGENSVETTILQNAAVMLFLIPLIVLFVFCQKTMVKSIVRSGLAN